MKLIAASHTHDPFVLNGKIRVNATYRLSIKDVSEILSFESWLPQFLILFQNISDIYEFKHVEIINLVYKSQTVI